VSTLYLAVKLLHILLAITAVGANITYGVWFARANAQPAFAPVALRGIKFIDDYIANPCYLLMLPTGILMVRLAGFSFGTHWISWAMGLWLLAIVLAYGGYSPSLRKQIAVVEAFGIGDPRTGALAVRANVFAGVLGVVVIAILVLMVFKPS